MIAGIFRIFLELNLSFNIKYIKLHYANFCLIFADNLLSDSATQNLHIFWRQFVIRQCFLLPICCMVMQAFLAKSKLNADKMAPDLS